MKTTRINIEGMTCEGCVAGARQALQRVSGVSAVDVDLAHGRASVEHHEEVSESDLIAAVEDAGYDAQSQASGSPK